MIDYEQELNTEQLPVVMAERGPLLVLAGAGSGKTRTLTYRVARLLEQGVPPQRIMLVTFTNKAARSMLSRVASLVPENVNGLWGGTFHHLGNRILRRHADLLGYDRNYTILDAEDAVGLLGQCATEVLQKKDSRFPKKDILYEIISFSVNTGTPLPRVIEERYPSFVKFTDEIRMIYERYRSRKKELNTMDFDDLLFNWWILMRDFPHIGEYYRERFLHVLVDEYQDTNYLQGEITDYLGSHHRNLMVVGDDAQSIYAFRGANYANILTFPERHPDSRIFRLETNYRSTPEILHIANLSIRKNTNQFQKRLVSVRENGQTPILVFLRNDGDQARFVANKVMDCLASGIPPHQIAILYRAHFQSVEVQMELARRGVLYDLRSGLRFFEQAHVKDVVAYLRVLFNGRDEIAWNRILGMYEGIGKATADRIWRHISEREDPLGAFLEAETLKIVPRGARESISSCQRLLKEMLEASPEKRPGPLIEALLKGGYEEYVQCTFTNAQERIEELIELILFAERSSSLEEFLAEVALQTSKTEAGDEEKSRSEGRIILSTIHQAKGLEWQVVFIIWCADGMLPYSRALMDPSGEEEERRLFYVAITRARDALFICYPAVRNARGSGWEPMRVSRFIKEIVSSCPDEYPFQIWHAK